MKKCKEVLEPSCGSCEFVLELYKQYPDIKTTAVELNKTIFNSITHLSNNNIDILNCDYLNYQTDKKFDLIQTGSDTFPIILRKLILCQLLTS